MKIYELKADPKLPHHYFIAVGIRQMNSSNPGEMFLKYRPFYLHHSQIEKFRDVSLLIQDKLFKTTQKEALLMHGLYDVASTFSAFRLASSVNQCTIHHFSSENEIEEEWFEVFVKSANISKSTKEQLFDARVKY